MVRMNSILCSDVFIYKKNGLDVTLKEHTFANAMLKIMAIMFAGIALGYLVREVRGVERVASTTMLTIVLLLFVMGCEIGANPRIVENLTSLGVEALLISVAATLGSVLMAWVVYRRFFRGKEGGDAK